MTTYRLAGESDDATIRALLRENPMSSWVEMTIEREPSYAAGSNLFGHDWAVIAEDENDVVGMYTASVLPVYIDARPERVGYLGGLRVREGYRRRIHYLRDGYASIRALAPETGTIPWWFTVVATENTTARRLLEAGLRGLPVYHHQGDYITFALACARGKRRDLWRRATVSDLSFLVHFYNDRASRFQCSPVLTADVIERIGVSNFFVYAERGVAALWDQRAFKQIVARHYRRPLNRLRPLYNLYAAALHQIPLPPQGRALDQTSIAFLALDDSCREIASDLIRDLLSYCTTRAASIGLHAGHPLVPLVRAMKPISYPARIYAVCFEGGQPPAPSRPVQPEAALL